MRRWDSDPSKGHNPSKCAYFLKQNIVFISYIFIHIIITIILNRLALSAHGNTLIVILAALLITISLFLLLLLPYLNCSRYKLRCLDDDCKFKLLAEVITHKPNVDLSTWDRIAYDMNQFVYDRRICADRSFSTMAVLAIRFLKSWWLPRILWIPIWIV